MSRNSRREIRGPEPILSIKKIDFVKLIRMKKSHVIVLSIGAVLFLVFNLFDLHAGLSRGGDASQYLTFAENIVSGRPYRFSVDLENKLVPPPGFPVLLAPLIKVFGLNLKILKIPNLFYWLGFIAFLYPIFNRRIGRDFALLISLCLLAQPAFVFLKQGILTDIPFLFFLTMGLYFLSEYSLASGQDGNRRRDVLFYAGIGSLCAGFFIRWSAVTLYAAAALYFAFVKRDRRMLWGLAVSFLLAVFIQIAVGTSPEHYMTEISRPFPSWIKLSGFRAREIVGSLSALLFPLAVPENYAALILNGIGSEFIVAILAAFIPVAMLFLLVRGVRRKSLSLVGCFFIVYFLSNIVWWKPGGERYLLPILGLALLFLIEGALGIEKYLLSKFPQNFHPAAEQLLKIFLILLIMNNVLNCFVGRDRHQGDFIFPQDRSFGELTAWIRAHTSGSDRFCSFHSRLIVLHVTGRQGIYAFNPYAKGLLRERIRRFGLKYVIMSRAEAAVFLGLLGKQNIPVKNLWENEEYQVLQIVP